MRKPRVLLECARYHISARANRGEMIMADWGAKALFLEVVARAKEKYDFRIENFCVMENHFHFILQPGKGVSLSRIMQWILSVFAMAWNRLHGLKGHVWGERFFSKIIETAVQYFQVFRYIDENPVRAQLVERPEDWPFGGPAFRRSGKGTFLDDVPADLAL
jgi:putative transposase